MKGLYQTVKGEVDKALFPLFREECKFLAKNEIPGVMTLYQCRHPENKYVDMQPELPNCACQGCPIYKP